MTTRVLYITRQELFRASVRYRCHNMAKQLLQAEHDIETRVLNYGDVTLKDIQQSDIVIFHRFISSETAFKWALASSNTLVGIDFDDLTFLPYCYEQSGGHKTNPDRDTQKFMDEYRARFEMVCMADFITVSTSELHQQLATLGIKSFMVRNCIAGDIPLPEIKLEKSGLKNILFMSGTITHDEDLRLIARVMEIFLNKHPDVKWTILGSIVNFPKNLANHPQVIRKDLIDFDQLPSFVSSFDLNIFSLEDTVFNDCKSALKFYEAGYVGVPTLASPRREFREMITDGVNGFLANTEKEWLTQLEHIYANPKLLDEVAKNAYNYVHENYTTTRRNDSYAKLLHSLLEEHFPGKKRKADITQISEPTNSNIEVSVVLTSYNHGKFIGKTIKSILEQDFPFFELIIIDDCSTDDSVKIIESFKNSRIRFYQNKQNIGMVKTVNKGIQRARGKYIAHMNSDDIWNDMSKLSKQVAYLQSHPECGAVFTRANLIDEKGEPLKGENKFLDSRAANKSKENWLKQFYLGRNRFCYPTAMIRKSVFDEIGLYDPRYSILLDLDMWVRICMHYEIYILDDICIDFRKGDNSYSYVNRKYVDFEYGKVYEHYLKMSYAQMMAVFRSDFSKIFNNKVNLINEDNYKVAFLKLGLKQVDRQWMFVIPKLHDFFAKRDYRELGLDYRSLHDLYKRYMDKFFLANESIKPT